MLVIFGFRTKAHRLGPVMSVCQVCRQPGQLILDREVTKFTLFFIPLFPVRTRHVLHCLNPACGATTKVSPADVDGLLAVR
jgi:hypothetical protein